MAPLHLLLRVHFPHKNQQDVAQLSCSVAETTKKFNKDSVVQHKKRELNQVRDAVGTPVWTKSITSIIVNKRGEALLCQ